MNILLSQLNYTIADFDGNLARMAGAIRRAEDDGADLVVFSELSVCGYPPLDLLEQIDFIERCREAILRLAAMTTKVAVIAGAPAVNPNEKGKKLYNAAYLLQEGRVAAVRYKTLLPTYDIFDEYRYFEPNTVFEVVEFKGVRIALTICEDIWDDQPVENAFARTKLYTVSPMEHLIRQKPDLLINLSASPFAANRLHAREAVLRQNAVRYGIPILYCNQVGANTDLIFDGGSMILDASGEVVDRFEPFIEDTRACRLEDLLSRRAAGETRRDQKLDEEHRIEMIHDALIFGIRDYFRKTGFRDAVLGLSGGMDSALTLVLAATALGNEHVHPVLMPSRYSSDHSVHDSVRLAENLGVRWEKIAIDPVTDAFNSQLGQVFKGRPEDITEENIQARTRGVILMAIANKMNMILLNTSNKSEAAVGYATLYGDMNGGLSVLGDVYKTDIYKMARFINREMEIIPENIFLKPPSAELRPGQKDSDSLPPYEILDPILYRFIEMKESVRQIVEAGYPEETVRRIINLVNSTEYKRFQAPPILRVSSKAFGMGRRIPIVVHLTGF